MAAPELIAGPYMPPPCQAGDWLVDEIEGRLQVGGWTAAPISWPRRKKNGRPSLILCGDLVRAVRSESVEAICHWWGVGPTKVWMWRQALGVERVTEGTRRLLQERTGVPPEAAARGRERAASPESRAKIAAGKRGVPAPPKTRAALLAAARRRKGAVWGVRANAWMRGVDLPELHTGEWTAAEDALLIKHQARRVEAVAVLVGRTPAAVQSRRAKLKIMTPIGEILWSEADLGKNGPHPRARGDEPLDGD